MLCTFLRIGIASLKRIKVLHPFSFKGRLSLLTRLLVILSLIQLMELLVILALLVRD